MTHDELLEKINKEIQPCGTHTHFQCKSREENLPWQALRAVVELHKPIEPDIYLEEDEKYLICSVCMEFDEDVKYPCPTIKAIEEELK